MEEQTLIAKLIDIQGKLVVPKSRWNDFGKFHYRTCDDVINAVKPLAHEHGLALLLTDELQEMDGRYYVHATASLVDPSGELVSANGYAREAGHKKGSDDAQVTGMASTYARKYALNGLLALDDAEDPDMSSSGAVTGECTACGVRYEFADAQQMRSFTCQCGNAQFKAV